MVISYPEKMEIAKLSYKFEFSHKREVGMKTPSNHKTSSLISMKAEAYFLLFNLRRENKIEKKGMK